MRVGPIVLALATGCGRLGFSEADTDASQTDAVFDSDASSVRGPCPPPAPIPNPLMAVGTTVQVPAFGSPTAVQGVTVEVSDTLDGPPSWQTTSASNGSYSLSITSGGTAITGYFALRKSGYLPSLFVPDAPVDANVINLYSPITTNSTVSTLYTAMGVARNTNEGTILVMVFDCDGVPVTDATISITPPPARIIYTDNNGNATAQPTMTQAKGTAYGLGVPMGNVRVTASKNGETFLAHDVQILDTNHVMGTELRPVR